MVDSNNNDNNSSNNGNNEVKPNDILLTEEPEESVRDLVNRLENSTLNARSKPRIIESKCIEKLDECRAAEPAITINCQSAEVGEAPAPPPPPEPPATVTVNNHITVPGQLLIPPLLKGGQPPATEPAKPSSTFDRPPKVCRNKNVDLAFAATISHNKPNNKPAKEKENQARKSSLVMTNCSVDSVTDSSSEVVPPSSAAASVAKTVTFNFQQPKDDENNNERKVPRVNGVESVIKPSAIVEQGSKQEELTSPKLVNWSTLGKFDERQYFANDKKLIEKRKYDDMEFEEFEVLDPNAPIQQQQQQQSECYDSLNSSK
ncbi:protein javelin [Toxorhynchites rutilus septentrionalis]|uniref:protein javelin n=1 Tax=Toxorhynchites rutilus septentrionalis TaxID=329112 RepID=UPI00247A635E|nr:protein javelin [Toxorhynchites rutilus septentrionalis]